MSTNGNVSHVIVNQPPPSSVATDATDATNATSPNSNLSKDEVGWYFVEQYYTTLSKSPEKLHLFYGKRSQFVYGLEAEVANVSVGRQAIQEKIKALDFQDCKVRISNVDSQASFENIVIQVIGETSNKAGEPKKFVQTFVLAQQPSGYFVLNDILRYINEESDEESQGATRGQPQTSEAPASAVAPVEEAQPEAEKQEEVLEEKAPAALDTAVIDKKLEEAGEVGASPAVSDVNPPAATTAQATGTDEAKAPADPEKVVQELAEEDAEKSEVPQNPSPTPAASGASAPSAAESEKPRGPLKPMTWASRAAAAAGPPKPVVPLPKTAAPPAQSRPAVPAASPQPAAPSPTPAPTAPSQAPEASPTTSGSKEQDSEWKTAGSDSRRQNRPQSVSGPPAEKEGTMAYIKYVTEKVKAEDLRAALSTHGELAYFDINRTKNCAFVEFATQAGYNAAVSNNPHVVNGETIVVEQRRPKANAYGGSNYAGRGGAPGRGRGGYDGGRAGSQGGSRGGFAGQSRGRGGAPRGRGASQAAANA